MKVSNLLQAVMFAVLTCTAPLLFAATPTALFNNATITTVPNTIMASRVPVLNSAGKIVYQDVRLNFLVSSTGLLSLTTDSPIITPSQNPIVSGFKPGQYKDTNGNKYTLAGPGIIPGTARTAWSLSLNAGSTQATQFSVSWVTGAITGHPNESAITADSITTTAFSWGIVGINLTLDRSFTFSASPSGAWSPPQVIGANQIGNQLVIHLFQNNDNIEDASAALQLCTTAAC